jgi:HAD superfamily hydrolase (TIGR01509 family)
MKYKGAIFDLDGTLLDSMPVWANLGRDYLLSQGVRPPADISGILKPMSLLQAAVYFQTEFNLPLTAEEMICGFNALIERQYRESVQLKPHALPFLKSLSEAGVRLCVVTANDRPLTEAALLRLGVLQYFDFILTCTEAGSGKDEPHIFLQAVGMLGTPKEETILFEDALHAVATAKNAGLDVCGVFDASSAGDAKAIREIADYYIDSFEDWEDNCR